MTSTYNSELSRYQNYVARLGINVPDHVNPENEAAYVNSAVARIAGNWFKGNRARWLAAHSDAQRLKDWLLSQGEFCGSYDHNDIYRPHPLAIQGNSDFVQLLRKFATDLDECGNLSDKQTEIVRNALARQERFHAERQAKREVERAALASTAQHIGTVGKREVFTLTIQWVKYYEGAFGASYIHGLTDAAGNVVIYKGSKSLGSKGAVVTVKATVKEHGERDGVKQTVISRPAAA